MSNLSDEARKERQRECVRRYRERHRDEIKQKKHQWYIEHRSQKTVNLFEKSETLCWECANAVPDMRGHGCSWSMDFKPVAGWTAERRDIHIYDGKNQETYIVRHCPEFCKEG